MITVTKLQPIQQFTYVGVAGWDTKEKKDLTGLLVDVVLYIATYVVRQMLHTTIFACKYFDSLKRQDQ